jgi:nuclear transport factor 2 (NTF2) superfamily protein
MAKKQQITQSGLQDATRGHWYRSSGNENWEFNDDGLMAFRFASIYDYRTKVESYSKWHV